MRSRSLLRRVTLPLVVAGIVGSSSTVQSGPAAAPRAVKVLVIVSVPQEAQPWVTRYQLTDSVNVTGLDASAPAVLCNTSNVCLLTTGMGKANAAASVSAVLYGKQLDLSKAYFLVATAAAMNPAQGTVGSAAWASYAADFALSWEIDARSIPSTWTTGYLGFGTTDPTQPPATLYGTEVYSVAPALLTKALALSKTATLGDNAAAQAYRAFYGGGDAGSDAGVSPATQPPTVLQCDAMSGDTLWGGSLLGQRAQAWMTIMTNGHGNYCTTQQTDNATLAAITRGGTAGVLDSTRFLVLHTGAMFDRPYAGQSAFDGLAAPDPTVTTLALDNLALAGEPFVDDVVSNWTQWQQGVPQ